MRRNKRTTASVAEVDQQHDGVPRHFGLAGHKISVSTVKPSRWKHGKDCVGIWIPDQYKIEMLSTLKGSARAQVFCHEMLHAVFDVAGYEELSRDEKMIDALAHLLAQALTTFDEP